MGYWGNAPWDNDYAADWFGAVVDETKIGDVIDRTLSKSVDCFNCDEIRGAISLFILMGRVYVYDIYKLGDHLERCILKNLELKKFWSEGGWDGDPEVGQWLDFELAVLQRRANNVGVPEKERPAITSEMKDWWAKWID